jgi:hypothetical protein
VLVWVGAAVGLVVLTEPAVRDRVVGWCRAPWLACGFVLVVAVVALVAYPVFDGRRDSGRGSDADDGVFLVLDGLRDGGDPYAEVTYLGNPATTGPGSVLWFLPVGTRTLYPVGIAAAVALTVAAVRWRHGRWEEAGCTALLLAASVPFWQGVGQGSDHVVFACSLVWAVCALRSPTVLGDRRLLVLAAVVVGTLSTARAVFGFVPALAAMALWWRDRRSAAIFGGVGTAVVVALHAWLIARSGWDDYDPVQQLLVKGGDELPAIGKAVLAVGIAAGAALVLRELRRRDRARAELLLLGGVAVPMGAVAIAGLWAEPVEVWSGANYLVDGVVLAAYWVTSRVLPTGPTPAPPPPPG